MLEFVLGMNRHIDQINGFFTADPFIQGCRCYLGRAAKEEFNVVEISKKNMDLVGKFEFTKNNYATICENLEKKKYTEGYAKITKNK